MAALALTEFDLQRSAEALWRLRESLRPASADRPTMRAPFVNVWDASDRLTSVSANVEEILGWGPDHLLRISPGLALFRPGDPERVYPHFFRALMGHPANDVEYRLMHADGSGYVWLSDDMKPVRRGVEARAREVRMHSYDITPLRAREIDFVLECLRLFHPRRDTEALEELGVPALLAALLPDAAPRGAGRLVLFRFPAVCRTLTPGLEPALSGDYRRGRRPGRR